MIGPELLSPGFPVFWLVKFKHFIHKKKVAEPEADGDDSVVAACEVDGSA